MSGATYTSPAGRINRLKGEMLKHAIPVEVMGITGMQRKIPRNQGSTIVYRRYIPYGAALTNANTENRPSVSALAHALAEGVTPTADSLVPSDVTVSLEQYGCLYKLSDKAVDMHEDNIPDEMKKQCGERMGLLREMIRWGVVKGGTNVYYSGGTTRATTDEKVTLNLLRKISRNLQSNHAKRITSVLSAAPDYGTTPVEAGYLVFGHTDLEADFRDLTGFKHVSEYGQRKPMHEQEIGSVENFRIILSPELNSYPDAGGANALLYGTTNSAANIDVYPIIVCGEDAWGQVMLRGSDSVDPTYIPPGEKTKDDPLGQRGFIGAKFYMNCVRLNEGWMAVGEVGTTAL